MENDHLRRLREAKGLSMQALAARAGTTSSQISKLEKGLRRLTPDWVRRLASALGEEPAVVAGYQQPQAQTAAFRILPVVGTVQAGVWGEALELMDDEDFERAAIPVDPRYLNQPLFALRVCGPSMDRLYPDGTLLVCLRYADLGRGPKPGERVICQRSNRAGLCEATVKELQVDADGQAWLWPRSDHPEHQQPLRLPPSQYALEGLAEEAAPFLREDLGDEARADVGFFDDGQTEAVEILARVVGSYRPE